MKLAVLALLLIAAAAAVNAQPSVGCNDKSKVGCNYWARLSQNLGAAVTHPSLLSLHVGSPCSLAPAVPALCFSFFEHSLASQRS
jgi:hypothetical protein